MISIERFKGSIREVYNFDLNGILKEYVLENTVNMPIPGQSAFATKWYSRSKAVYSIEDTPEGTLDFITLPDEVKKEVSDFIAVMKNK